VQLKIVDCNMKEKIISFFEDVVKEMKKVTWPTKAELFESSKVVIVVCIILAGFTYVIDMIINQVIQGIF
jgi:preprotein translocase subunit SecE